jgi:hypothetical protein
MKSLRIGSVIAALGLLAAALPGAAAAASPGVVQTVQVTFISTICPGYTVVPANRTPANFDETGGHFAQLDTSYQLVLVDPTTDIPAACVRADGWQFQMYSDPGISVPEGTPVTTGADGVNTGSTTISLDANEIALAQTTGAPTGLWISSIKQPGIAGFGALRCFNDMNNGDDRENVQGIGSSSLHIYCIVYSVLAPETYHAVTPTRLLDTRNGTGIAKGTVGSKSAKTFTVVGGVVPSTATAVTGNLTETGATGAGFLFIGPTASNNPASSNLNFPVGDTRANSVTVGLGTGGTLSFTYVSSKVGATTHVVFDVTGYFTPDDTGATYHEVVPTRLLDSRNGTGGVSGAIGSKAPATFPVTGGIVPDGATAVTGNLTVTGATGGGFLFIGPAAIANPGSSNLNFPAGDTRANGVTVELGAGVHDTLSVTYVSPVVGAKAHVIFDVTGYFTADLTGSHYIPVSPARILDSRIGTGGVTGPIGSKSAKTFPVVGAGRVDAGATAVTGNLTVTNATGGGFLSIGPVADNNPGTSTLNFPAADTRANAVTVGLGSGNLSVTYVAPHPGPTVQAIFDVTGYFI